MMHSLEAYPLQSRIGNVHPGIKMGLFALYTSLALASPSVLMSMMLFITIGIAIVYTSRIRLGQLIRLILVPVSFVFWGSIMVMVDANATSDAFHLNVFGCVWGITPLGWQRGWLLFFRSFSAILVLYALVLNTSVNDMLAVLRRLRVPDVLLDVMVLVYRNIFIFSDTATSIYTSQKSRLGYQNIKTSLHSTAQLGGRLYVLGSMRADHLYRSMESRCYNGKLYSLPREWQVNVAFVIVALVLAALFALGIVFYHLYN